MFFCLGRKAFYIFLQIIPLYILQQIRYTKREGLPPASDSAMPAANNKYRCNDRGAGGSILKCPAYCNHRISAAGFLGWRRIAETANIY